jgi:hypothetical protein
MIMDMLAYRPCGVCVAYVPAESGCPHWRPKIQAPGAASARRARNREYQRRAREAASAAVAEFRRQQGIG